MKCNNCSGEMALRRFLKNLTYESGMERFLYECSNCGVIDFPKPNINYNQIKENNKLKLIQCIKEFGLLCEKEAFDFLIKHPNPFPIIAMFSKRDSKIVKKFNLGIKEAQA